MYLATPVDFAGADDIISNLSKGREPHRATGLPLLCKSKLLVSKYILLNIRFIFLDILSIFLNQSCLLKQHCLILSAILCLTLEQDQEMTSFIIHKEIISFSYSL